LGDPCLRKALADEVRTLHSVEETSPPRIGLVLVTARESARRSLFHLGEVLVSEAKVRVFGSPGLGLIRGRDLEAAMDLAVIDAAWTAGLSLTEAWLPRLEKAEAELELALEQEQAVLARTRVDFETLDSGMPR
jgi:alpha-D-ribose 1-methylphosphonate 5-triphosphate synthase subunit PhnG